MVLISFVVNIENNNLDQLFDCIESILSQDFNDIEIILKNSSKKIIKDIKKILKNENKIRFISIPKDSNFKNMAIEKAFGEYICFLNSNEIVQNDSLSKIQLFLLNHKEDILSLNRYNDKKTIDKMCFVKIFDKKERTLPENYGLPLFLSKNILKKTFITENNLNFLDDSKESEILFLANVLKKINYFVSMPLTFLKINGNEDECNTNIILTFTEYEKLLSLLSSEKMFHTSNYLYCFLNYLKKINFNKIERNQYQNIHNVINKILLQLSQFPPNILKHELKINLLYILDEIDNSITNFDVLVSVIIPTYNVEDYLDECLNSLLNQTFSNIEIIIVDDCSTDSTQEIISYYEKKDHRIKTVISNKKIGPGGCRNIGLNLAKGKYIQFVDSDDWVDNDAIEQLYNYAEKFKTQILQFKVIIYDDSERLFKRTDYYNINILKDFENKTFNVLSIPNGPFYITNAVWNKFYLKSFLNRISVRFPENIIFEDNPFFFHVFCEAQNIYFINEYYYNRRIRPNSITASKNTIPLNTIDIVEHVLNIFLKNELYKYYKEYILNYIISQIKKYSENIPKNLQKEFKSIAKMKIYKFMFEYELYEDFSSCLYGYNKDFLNEILNMEDNDYFLNSKKNTPN